MSSPPKPSMAPPAATVEVPPAKTSPTEGLFGVASLDEQTEKRLDAIEMIGEEEAAGFRPRHSEISACMRYLHCSRTIHQLVTDRNRAVGIYLAVASLLWTASSAILNASEANNETLLVPLGVIKRWCIPATAGSLT